MAELLTPEELHEQAKRRIENDTNMEHEYVLEHVMPPLVHRINLVLVHSLAYEVKDPVFIDLYQEIRQYSEEKGMGIHINENQEMFILRHLRKMFETREDVHISFDIYKPQQIVRIHQADPKAFFHIYVSVGRPPETDICSYYDGLCTTRVENFKDCHEESNCGTCPYLSRVRPLGSGSMVGAG